MEEIKSYVFENSLLKSWFTIAQVVEHFSHWRNFYEF